MHPLIGAPTQSMNCQGPPKTRCCTFKEGQEKTIQKLGEKSKNAQGGNHLCVTISIRVFLYLGMSWSQQQQVKGCSHGEENAIVRKGSKAIARSWDLANSRLLFPEPNDIVGHNAFFRHNHILRQIVANGHVICRHVIIGH